MFIVEQGDNIRLPILLLATNKELSKYTVFFGASLAVIFPSDIRVLAGRAISQYVNKRYIHYVAELVFLGNDVITFVKT